jgi:large subunit ribosomal protein L30
MATKIQVTQTRSAIGRPKEQGLTLRGLGLRRRHHTVVVKDTPAIRGMITKVQHLVEVQLLEGEAELFGQRHTNPKPLKKS